MMQRFAGINDERVQAGTRAPHIVWSRSYVLVIGSQVKCQRRGDERDGSGGEEEFHCATTLVRKTKNRMSSTISRRRDVNADLLLNSWAYIKACVAMTRLASSHHGEFQSAPQNQQTLYVNYTDLSSPSNHERVFLTTK